MSATGPSSMFAADPCDRRPAGIAWARGV